MADLEQQYSPSSRAGGSAAPYVDDWQTRSRAARETLGDRVVTVGSGSLLVPGPPGAPLLVFVHGGYWQALSAAESLFLAPPLLGLGWSFAALEYTLAPAADLAGMVREVTAALAALAGAGTGAGAGRTVLAGHSAGAHLAAMVALSQQAPLGIDRLVLVSGVYDLRPLVHTTVNDPLGLDEVSAAAVSPALLPVRGGVADTVVVWAADDTEAFHEQGATYAAAIGARTLCCAGRHHFDIVDDLADPGTPLGALTLSP